MLIGMQLSDITSRLASESLAELLFTGVIVSAVAILVRFAWIHPAAWLSRAIGNLRGPEEALPEKELIIMSWCGMRGIVSLAAALALPVALPDGTPFPQRDLIVFLTFVVIAATLVLQGLTLSPLIRRLKVAHDWSALDEQRHARQDVGEFAARDGAVHAQHVGRQAAHGGERGLAAGPQLGAFFLFRRFAHFGAERVCDICDTRDRVVDFGSETVGVLSK